MAQVQQDKAPQQFTPEQQEERKEKARKESIVGIELLVEYGPRLKQSILGTSSVEYFKGVDFHVAVIELSDELRKRMPFVFELLKLKDITSVEESVHFGKFIAGLGLMVPVMPHPNLYGQNSKEKAPKALAINKVPVSEGGLYIFNLPKNAGKAYFWLGLMIAIALFFLLFKVWPDWLRIGVWYVSFYLLCALIGIAIVRVILYVFLFHFGIDFWLFPNYFIDSNDIFDSFRPAYSFDIRGDMTSVQMTIVRIASACAIVYCGNEFIKDPENISNFTDGSSEIYNDVFEWGQNKFLGIPDNSTAINVKKSAREIYAEAFGEHDAFKRVTIGDWEGEEAAKQRMQDLIKAEEELDEMEQAEEFDIDNMPTDDINENNDEGFQEQNDIDIDAILNGSDEDDEEDPLEKLMGNSIDDDDEIVAEESLGEQVVYESEQTEESRKRAKDQTSESAAGANSPDL